MSAHASRAHGHSDAPLFMALLLVLVLFLLLTAYGLAQAIAYFQPSNRKDIT